MSRTTRDRSILLVHRLAPPLAGLLALALYASTLPSSLTWAHNGADGGDLLAAALTGGVPHPTGYPTYQVLLRLALAIHGGNPARTGAWLSAISVALAVALLVGLCQRMLRERSGEHRAAASVAALTAGLAWAASWTVWGQATIVEVYALNALFCVALLWIAWRWAESPAEGRRKRGWLAAAGLVLGLGFGNHLTVALMLPGLAFWFWSTTRVQKRSARGLAWTGLGLLGGLLIYLYLPLAASSRPPINWGDPVTLDRLLWVASGRLYTGYAFGLPLAELPSRLLGWATVIVMNLLPWGLLLALAGLALLERRLRTWWIATLLVWLACSIYAVGYNTTDSDAYLIPAFAVMALWVAEALAALLGRLAGRPAPFAGVALLALVALVAVPVAWSWEEQKNEESGQAESFAMLTLEQAEPDAVLLTASDARTFALWYAVYGLQRRPDLAILNVNLYGYDWYRRTFAETHPDLLPSAEAAPSLDALIATLRQDRPLYAVEDLGLALPGPIEEEPGGLTRLR